MFSVHGPGKCMTEVGHQSRKIVRTKCTFFSFFSFSSGGWSFKSNFNSFLKNIIVDRGKADIKILHFIYGARNSSLSFTAWFFLNNAFSDFRYILCTNVTCTFIKMIFTIP